MINHCRLENVIAKLSYLEDEVIYQYYPVDTRLPDNIDENNF